MSDPCWGSPSSRTLPIVPTSGARRSSTARRGRSASDYVLWFSAARGTEYTWLNDELGDRYIQRSALLPSGAGVVLACEQRGVWYQPLPTET